MASRVTSQQLIGRTEELGALQAALREARDGQPRLALVAGESGVGKSRLVAELEARAAGDGVRVLRGECVELGEGELAYAPITAALRPLARDADPALTSLSPGARHALPGLLPGLGGAVGDGRVPLEAEGARAVGFEALLELFGALAADDGLLLVLEDLHWADASTRAFLRFLAVSLVGERLLVVGTYRADELHRRHPLRPLLADLERLPATRRVELQRLTREELAQQLADIAGSPPDPDLLDRLWLRSEGNPLFAEELLASGLDGRGALPPTLRDALMLRVERLSPVAQDIVRAVAVGVSVGHELLAAAAQLPGHELRDGLRDTVSSQILRVDADDGYGFRHALLREAVLDDLLPGERAELHRRFARALEARGGLAAADLVAVANHYAAADDHADALRTAIGAGYASRDVHAFDEAAAHFERALELWPKVPDPAATAGLGHVDLYRAAAAARRTSNEPQRAVTLLRAAEREIDADADPDEAAEVLERLAAAEWMSDRVEDSVRTRSRAYALLGDDDRPRPARALLLSTEAKQLMLAARYREAATVARRAIDECRATGERAAEAAALDALGFSLAATGAHEEGLDTLRAAIDLTRRAELHTTMLTAFVNLADAAMIAGRLDDARSVADEAARQAQEIGYSNRWIGLVGVELELLAGDFAAAAAKLPERAHPSQTNTWHNDCQRRIDLALARGEHDRARTLLDGVRGTIADSRQPQFIGPHAVARAELERRAGDLDAARRAVDEGLDRIEFCSEDRARIAAVAAQGVRVEADAALRARDLGDAAAETLARARAGDLAARFATIGADAPPVERAEALVARAAAQRADGADDPLPWTRAAAAWDALGWAYRAALARLAAAEATLVARDRDGAATLLAGLRDAAAAMDATWLRAEVEGLAARARLRLTAASPGATADGGGADAAPDGGAVADGRTGDTAPDDNPFGLTDRERQVLALVAAGRTNREIGQALYMAEKTASVHVSRILAKLDVRSRIEAAGVAHRVGLA